MNKQNKYWYDRLNQDKRKQDLKKDTILFIKGMIAIFIFYGGISLVIYLKKESTKIQTEKTK